MSTGVFKDGFLKFYGIETYSSPAHHYNLEGAKKLF